MPQPESAARPPRVGAWGRSAGLAAPTKPVSPSVAWLIVVFVVVLGCAWFATIGTRSLLHPDEGRYATLALAMARSGDWLTPRLDGLLYFEKPPLQYWIGAAAFSWLGKSEFAARLWPALAGFLTVLAVGATAARLWGLRTGLRALAVAGSMTWIVANSHFLSLDSGLTLWLTLALCAWLLAEEGVYPPTAQRLWMLGAWVAMACATLSKGLVGVLIPGCVLLLSAAWQRDAGLLRRLHWRSGLALWLAIVLPWFALMAARHPDFLHFFFVHEHFERYTSTAHRREGAWWYFVPLLLAGMLPWTSALPWLAARPAAAGRERRVVERLLVWVAFVFVFFSFSGSKLPSYILPLFPALALLVARRLDGIDETALLRHLMVPLLVWLAVLMLSTQARRFGTESAPPEVLAALGRGLRWAAAVFIAGAAPAVLCLARRQVTGALLCVALAHTSALFVAMQAHDAFGQLKSAAPIARAIKPLLAPETPLFAVRTYDQTLPFYLDRDAVLVDYEDEFAFGQQHEPGRSIPSLDDFAERWLALPQAVAYMEPSTRETLLARGLPMRTVFQDARRFVVMRR